MLRTLHLLLLSAACLSQGCSSNVAPEDEPQSAVEVRDTETMLRLAQEAYSAGNNAKAIEHAAAVLLEHPKHPGATYLLSHCYAKEKRFADAIEMIQMVPPNQKPYGIPSLLTAAQWSLSIGSVDEAIELFEKALSIAPNNIGASRRLARVFNDQGRRFEASQHLKAALVSGNADIRELLALVRISDPFHDPEDRHKHARKSKGDVVLTDLADARSLYAQHRTDEARTLIEKLQRAYPRSSAVSGFAMKFHAEMLDDKSVIDLWSSHSKEAHREPEFWSGIGIWLLSQDHAPEAIRALCEALERDPSDGKSYLKLSQALRAVGQHKASKLAASRYDQIRELAHTAHVINFENGGPPEFLKLAEQLDALNRPWEALCWRINVAKLNKTIGSQVRAFAQQATAIRQRTPIPLWSTCGLKKEDWPMPNVEDFTDQRSLNPPKGDGNYSVRFQDVAESAGLQFQYRPHGRDAPLEIMLHQLNGGGIAAFDYDNDGWPDVYLTQADGKLGHYSNTEPNELFRNLAGKRFSKTPAWIGVQPEGYGAGVAAGDLNQDGFLDLVVANVGDNVFLINNGDGTFREVDYDDERLWTASVATADINGDHLPDIIDVNYVIDPEGFKAKCWENSDLCAPHRFGKGNFNVYLNDGMGGFSESEDFPSLECYGFAAMIANFDGKAGNDIFISSDSQDNLYLLSNEASGGSSKYNLSDNARILGCAVSIEGIPLGCMGIASGDFDRNGTLDLHITNYTEQSNELLLQSESGIFREQAPRVGIYDATLDKVGFGTVATDLDHDGWIDIAVLNGHVVDQSDLGYPFRMEHQLFLGAPNRFTLATKEVGYFEHPTVGRSLATIDWNRDGRTDLIAGHLDQPVTLLENRGEVGSWIRFQLIGTESERDAIGATVEVSAGDESWKGWVLGGDGYLCSHEPHVHIGLGDVDTCETVTVSWPSGTIQEFSDLESGSEWTVIEGRTPIKRTLATQLNRR